MDIDELLNRYFEGETSSEEERELRAFFTSGNVPDRLAVYTPMFAYLEEESRKERQPDEALIPIDEDILFMLDAEKVEEKKTFTLRSVLYLVSGIAASFLLLLGLNHLLNPVDPCFCSDNYVVINGRCYTDIHKVRSMALEALQEVATPTDEYFPEADRDEALIPIDEDILFMLDAEKVEEKKTFTLRSVLYLVSGIAASFLLLLGLNHLLNPVDPCFCSDNYVVINGRCYTDIHKVRSMALEALQEVATPTDEYFPEADRDEADRMIIDNQLNELRSLFDDNE